MRDNVGVIYLPWPIEAPKVAKASTIVAVACHCRWHYRLKFNANVNYPLSGVYTGEKTL